MSKPKNIDKTHKHKNTLSEPPKDKIEHNFLNITPVKKPTLPTNNFSSILSPLPLPPKMDHPNH